MSESPRDGLCPRCADNYDHALHCWHTSPPWVIQTYEICLDCMTAKYPDVELKQVSPKWLVPLDKDIADLPTGDEKKK